MGRPRLVAASTTCALSTPSMMRQTFDCTFDISSSISSAVFWWLIGAHVQCAATDSTHAAVSGPFGSTTAARSPGPMPHGVRSKSFSMKAANRLWLIERRPSVPWITALSVAGSRSRRLVYRSRAFTASPSITGPSIPSIALSTAGRLDVEASALPLSSGVASDAITSEHVLPTYSKFTARRRNGCDVG